MFIKQLVTINTIIIVSNIFLQLILHQYAKQNLISIYIFRLFSMTFSVIFLFFPKCNASPKNKIRESVFIFTTFHVPISIACLKCSYKRERN